MSSSSSRWGCRRLSWAGCSSRLSRDVSGHVISAVGGVWTVSAPCKERQRWMNKVTILSRKVFIKLLAATVRCGQRTQHLTDQGEANCGICPPQIVVARGQNIWNLTETGQSSYHCISPHRQVARPCITIYARISPNLAFFLIYSKILHHLARFYANLAKIH